MLLSLIEKFSHFLQNFYREDIDICQKKIYNVVYSGIERTKSPPALREILPEVYYP